MSVKRKSTSISINDNLESIINIVINLTHDNCLLHITHIINRFNNHVDNNLIQSKMNNYFNKK